MSKENLEDLIKIVKNELFGLIDRVVYSRKKRESIEKDIYLTKSKKVQITVEKNLAVDLKVKVSLKENYGMVEEIYRSYEFWISQMFRSYYLLDRSFKIIGRTIGIYPNKETAVVNLKLFLKNLLDKKKNEEIKKYLEN